MEPAVKASLAQLKDDDQLPINTKWAKLKECLLSHGLAWTSTEAPAQVLCHPKNRGGIMLNAWDVHSKGARLLDLGASLTKIDESVAFQLSQQATTRKEQLEANRMLEQGSQGALAPVTGQERLLSCSSSHLAAFCRAVHFGCQTQEPNLKAKCNGQLSVAALAPAAGSKADDPFATMCAVGWPWLIIAAEVEAEFGDMPTSIQQALNTTQAVAQGQGECETMLTIAMHYQHAQQAKGQADLQACVDLASKSMPDCLPYLSSLGYYVQNYSGGHGWPLLHLLQHISASSAIVIHVRKSVDCI